MDIRSRIDGIVHAHPIVLFMKGTPQFPMCGFSARAAQTLKSVGARIHAVDVLADPEIRAFLPQYSDWPTFPQLFIRGELVGGCDIVEELAADGQLQRLVADAQASAA